MTQRTSSLRRLVASAGAFSLAMVGFAATAALAQPVAGNINPDAEGSITLYKHVEDATSTDNNPEGVALEGVVFQLEPVTNVDLTTAEGWTTIEAAYAGQPSAAPDLTGITLGTAEEFPATAANGFTTLSGLDVGAYYVTEIRPGGNLITTPAIPFLVTIPEPAEGGLWNYDVVAYPKNVLGVFTPTKTVGDPASEIGLDQTVDWTISVPIPASSAGYNEFMIEDALSADLDFDSWVSIAIDGIDLVTEDYTVDPATHTVTLTPAGLDKLNEATADAEAVVTAVIRTTVTALGVHENTATVTINGQPKDTDDPTTNWGALVINKVDSEDDSALDGAVFELYRAPSETACDTSGDALASETTEDGTATFDIYVGKNEATTGYFCIVETTAPQGYVLPANPVFGPYKVDAGSVEVGEVPAATTAVDIGNVKPVGPELPLTGAQGTLMFTLIGAGLLAAGATIAIVRRSHLKA